MTKFVHRKVSFLFQMSVVWPFYQVISSHQRKKKPKHLYLCRSKIYKHTQSLRWSDLCKMNIFMGRRKLEKKIQIFFFSGTKLNSLIADVINLKKENFRYKLMTTASRRSKTRMINGWKLSIFLLLNICSVWITSKSSEAKYQKWIQINMKQRREEKMVFIFFTQMKSHYAARLVLST